MKGGFYAAAFRLCRIIALSRVHLQVSSVFSPGNFQGFALVNQQRTNRISTGFTVEVSTEGTQLSYSNFDYLGQEPHYWQLPGAYQGNQVSSQQEPDLCRPLFSSSSWFSFFFFFFSCCHHPVVDLSLFSEALQLLRSFRSSLASIFTSFRQNWLLFFPAKCSNFSS